MTMDHAAAHERIADLALEPGRLAALHASPDQLDRALLDHAAGCDACRTDIEGWVRTEGALRLTLAGGPGPTPELAPIRAPESLRAVVLANVEASDAAPGPAVRPDRATPTPTARFRARPRPALLGLAAALVIAVVGGVAMAGQVARIDRLAAQARGLALAMTAVDRVLADPGHQVAELRTPEGARGGSISWTRRDLVVLTNALAEPAGEALYRCWLSDGGQGWAVGRMYFADGTGYWVGSLDEWAAFEIGPTTVFRVSLEPPGADPAKREGPIVLEADLGT